MHFRVFDWWLKLLLNEVPLSTVLHQVRYHIFNLYMKRLLFPRINTHSKIILVVFRGNIRFKGFKRSNLAYSAESLQKLNHCSSQMPVVIQFIDLSHHCQVEADTSLSLGKDIVHERYCEDEIFKFINRHKHLFTRLTMRASKVIE